MNAKRIKLLQDMATAQAAFNRCYESGNSRGVARAERTLDRISAQLDA